MKGMIMIKETLTRDVASAEMTDDCLVELWTRRPRLHLVPASARELAAELVRAAGEAERASAELLHPIEPAGFDLLPTPAVSPDCRDGKHRACTGDAWDAAADHGTSCDCPCHWNASTEEAAA